MLLAAEVVDHILSFLQSDRATLEICSRSHPIISQFAERHLYANITLQGPGDDFLNDLRDRPHIANYVQALKIEFSSSNIAYLEDISSILPKLLILRRIELNRIGSPSLSWQELPETFRLAFQDWLRLPSVKDITIHAIAFSLSILTDCKHIERLSLRSWQDDREAPMAGGDHTCLPLIDSVALHDCWWRNSPSSVSTISSWMKSRHLSSLEFNVYWENFGSLRHILVSCSHSLTSLDVDIDKCYGSHYESNTVTHPNEALSIPLSDLRNLQQLTIRAKLYHIKYVSGPWIFASPIFAIAQVLKLAHPLKRLILDFDSFFHVLDLIQGHITGVLCTSLHSLLVQSASTINVVHFRFKSVVKTPKSISSEDAIAMFAGHSDLTQFVERGKLILTPVD